MKLFLIPLSLAVLLLTHSLSTAGSPEENWHQWRGPEATGVSRTANPPIEWSEDKNVKWKIAIDGRGTSTPIVWNDKVFLLTAIETGVKDTSIPDPKDQPKTNFFDIKRPNTHSLYYASIARAVRNCGDERQQRRSLTRVPTTTTILPWPPRRPTASNCTAGSVQPVSIAMNSMATSSGNEIWAKPKLVPVSAKVVPQFCKMANL